MFWLANKRRREGGQRFALQPWRWPAARATRMSGRQASLTLGPPRPVWPGLMALAVVMLVVVATTRSAACAENVFRIGYSSAMFVDVNENDARAAMKVWGNVVARELNVPIETVTTFFRDLPSMEQALRQKQIDVIGMTTPEYAALWEKIEFSPIFLARNGETAAETYLLLAHQDGPVKKPADLRGRSLRVQSSLFASLAPIWLDVFLVQSGLPPTARLVGKATDSSKLAEVVLPVFFRQTEACLVSRSGFALMSELNPQVAQSLVVLAESDPVVPAVLACRADFDSPHRADILAGLADLHTTAAGQQVLTLFTSQALEEHPAASLDSALDLIAKHKRLVQ